MQCDYYDAGVCRSCTLIEQPYDEQLADKQAHVAGLLAAYDVDWLEPVRSRHAGFRNKAKMVVGGTVEHPSVGILDVDGAGVDLRGCRLHTPGIGLALPVLAGFVTTAGLTPYDVPRRRGELKHLLVTESPDGALMLRFVLRSEEAVARIRKHLPALLVALPDLRVVSVNLQPEHKAVLEGEREIVLTPTDALEMHVAGLRLLLRPQSFFQTNTEVAAALYRQVQEWVEQVAPASVWDLYCGVGGFALACAGPGRRVIGVEVLTEAVASARIAAERVGRDVRFVCADATAFARGTPAPELVVVNPPRRGIGVELATWLETSPVRHVVYSSCHAESLALDLAAMPTLRPTRGRLLDMFPQTRHHEVVVLLERCG
ncbi:MAG: 23S rRNA (uracil(747)-C(5))-methyltransferase RlmC [Nocardioides sp.]|nr:23S rRNA (uracil(747)-C(5))-methyltransferase RlmC [Nocardioides sp.]